MNHHERNADLFIGQTRVQRPDIMKRGNLTGFACFTLRERRLEETNRGNRLIKAGEREIGEELIDLTDQWYELSRNSADSVVVVVGPDNDLVVGAMKDIQDIADMFTINMADLQVFQVNSGGYLALALFESPNDSTLLQGNIDN